MCANFNPPQLLKTAVHALDKNGICTHGKRSYVVVQELQKH